jgi:hypothetical protein
LRWQTGWAWRSDLDPRELFSMFQGCRNKHENQQMGTAAY